MTDDGYKFKIPLLLFGICTLLGGCKGNSAQAVQPVQADAKPAPAIKPAPPTPIAEKKEELGAPGWDPQWDVVVEQALPPEMLGPKAARDVRGYCPRFSAMSEADKRAFWAYFFQALAGAEAGLKPTTTVRHTEPEVAKVDPVTKHTVRQQGLLQLAYMDADRYGCDFDWDKDKGLPLKDPARTILQPKNNLDVRSKDSRQSTLHAEQAATFPLQLLVHLATGNRELPRLRKTDDERAGGVPASSEKKNRDPRRRSCDPLGQRLWDRFFPAAL